MISSSLRDQTGEIDRDPLVTVSLTEQARLLELTHDTVIIRDKDDRILFWNGGAEELYGYSRTEAVGAHCGELLHCEFPSDEVKRAFQREGRWFGEMTRRRRDGTTLHLRSRWLQRRDADSAGIGVIETSADVTALQQADDERLRSERRFAAIFHAAGFATWESDWSQIFSFVISQMPGEGDLRAWLKAHPTIVREAAAKARIREVNRAALSLLGANTPQDLIGTSIIGGYPPGGENGFVEILAGLAEGAEVVEAETQLTTLDGRVVDVILRATLVPDGEPWSRTLVMAFDETERKEARARLEQNAADLAHASRISTLGQLAASIAHEVNQPLTAILNYAKSGRRWLGRETPEVGEATECFGQVVANASRAAEIIARVRSVARKSPPQVEPLDLPELVEEALTLLTREATGAGVKIQTVVGERMPRGVGDRVQVQQVVVNLAMNAIQAMRGVEGRERLLLVLLDPGEGSMARVAVEDRGPGIPGEEPSKIFQPFYTTKGDGMGMGLSICRSIIEGLGGQISAINNPGYGATVAFTLPAGSPNDPHTSV